MSSNIRFFKSAILTLSPHFADITTSDLTRIRTQFPAWTGNPQSTTHHRKPRTKSVEMQQTQPRASTSTATSRCPTFTPRSAAILLIVRCSVVVAAGIDPTNREVHSTGTLAVLQDIIHIAVIRIAVVKHSNWLCRRSMFLVKSAETVDLPHNTAATHTMAQEGANNCDMIAPNAGQR